MTRKFIVYIAFFVCLGFSLCVSAGQPSPVKLYASPEKGPLRRIVKKTHMIIPADSIPKKDSVCFNVATLNSKQDDYMPLLVNKHFVMITSNRYSKPETKAVEYSENAYVSKRKGKKKWSVPERNGYSWNSDNNTAFIGISPSRLYFYRSYWHNNGEIFYAERLSKTKNSPWMASRLKKLKDVDLDDFDECAISVTGDSTFFVSNRNGSYDIFLKIGKGDAEPLDELNTSDYDENDVFYSSDNKTVYFSSNRPGGFGGYDIYFSKINKGSFSKPVHINDTLINSPKDDRDFHWYNDSLMMFASNRDGGMGGLDIYQIDVKSTKGEPKEDDSEEFEEDWEDVVDEEKELIAKLKELGLLPFKGEVQIGAYQYIKSMDDFRKRFPCIVNFNVRMDLQIVDDSIKVHKYIIDTVFYDVKKALDCQRRMTKVGHICLPDKEFSDMPFIGILDKKGNRFAIFWKKDEFQDKRIYYIFKNGKIIWKCRKF